MSKRVPITPQLQAKIREAIGDPDSNTDKFAVFEARFVSTEPLKKGGIFNKARLSASTLVDMEGAMNKPGAAIPLHIMHNDRVLPVGRVFSSKVMNLPNGEAELRGQFLVPVDKTDLVNDIENSIIDEVSVGLATNHIFCSECGFDYLGADSSMMNFLDLECNEGHQIGVDGVHARLVGLNDWMELSLVGQGAANNAKILPRAKQSMGKDMVEKLVASGTPFEYHILTASTKMEITQPNEGESVMDSKEFLAQLSAGASELAETKLQLKTSTEKSTALETEVTTLKAAVETATAKIAELDAAKGQTQTDLETKLSKSETELTAAMEIIAPHVKAALAASGVAEKDLPTDLSAMVKLVEEKGLKLHQIVGAGSRSTEKSGEDLTAKSDPRKEAFKLSGNK